MDETSIEVAVGDVLRIGELRVVVRSIDGDEVVFEVDDSTEAGRRVELLDDGDRPARRPR